MRRSSYLPMLVAASVLAGCALQPPPKPDEIRAQALPHVQVPPAWTAPGSAPGVVRDNWLASFGDVQLDALPASPALAALFTDETRHVLQAGGGDDYELCFTAAPSQADAVRAWVGRGAAIYVCGSLQGMARGVQDALVEIVGDERVQALIAQGRYRRDLY